MAPRKSKKSTKKQFSYINPCTHRCKDKASCRHVCCAPDGNLGDLHGCDDFLGVNELLVMTMEFLPTAELLGLRLINKHFCALIDGSAPIQHALMLRPLGSTPSMKAQLMRPGPSGSADSDLVPANPFKEKQIWKSLPDRNLAYNALLFDAFEVHSNRNDVAYPGLVFRLDPDIGDLDTSLFAKMYITQPPVKEVHFRVVLCFSRWIPCSMMSGYNCGGASVTHDGLLTAGAGTEGLTWGDIVDTVGMIIDKTRARGGRGMFVTDMDRSYFIVPGLKHRDEEKESN